MNFRTFEYMFKQLDKADHALWKGIGNIYFARALLFLPHYVATKCLV